MDIRLQAARERFSKDIFATQQTGVIIEEVAENYARCSMQAGPQHMNAAGAVMGGALFTLADLAFAVAANENQPLTVSVTSNITYLNPGLGHHFTAEAHCDKSGKRSCAYTVSIRDETGLLVALVNIVGIRV